MESSDPFCRKQANSDTKASEKQMFSLQLVCESTDFKLIYSQKIHKECI